MTLSVSGMSFRKIELILDSMDSDKIQEIFPLLKQKAESGDGYYATIIADWMLNEDFGFKYSQKKYLHYLNLAVKAEVPEAIYRLSQFYDNHGDEKLRNVDKALPYLVLAAVYGHHEAIGALALFIEHGDILDKNAFVSKALKKHSKLLSANYIKLVPRKKEEAGV